jgi:hypothetical protein
MKKCFENEYLSTKIGVDAAENELPKFVLLVLLCSINVLFGPYTWLPLPLRTARRLRWAGT